MVATAIAIAWIPEAAQAREDPRRQIDIPAATLPDALAELSREAGISVGSDTALPRVRTAALHGRLSVGEALERLLRGTGLRARQVGATAWRIERAPAPAPKREARRSGPVAPPPPPEPILVTASKRATSLQDLAMSASVVDTGADGVARAGPLSGSEDIATETEGLTLTAQGSGRNRMFVRGVADSPFNGESQSTVAVVLDDSRLTYAAPDPDVALVDMKRVEVLKGPQGSLYGSGALGGIYHLVSNRADLDAATLKVEGGMEAVTDGGVGYAASAVANLPLAPGSAGLRLVGYLRGRPGWVDTGSRRDSNSDAMLGARAGLGLEPGGGWRVDLTGFMQLLEAHDSQYVYAPGARSRPAQEPEPHDNDLRHLSVRVAREEGGNAIVLSSGITWHEVVDTYDATVGAEGFGLADPQTLAINRAYRVWDSEARISGMLGSAEWLAGLSMLQASQNGRWDLAGVAASLVLDDDRRDTTDLAAFGDIALPLGGALTLDAGARLFHTAVSETRVLAAGPATRDLTRVGLTPSLALAWRPDERRLAFLRYGSAIRQGGLDISPSGELERLKGDELITIEAGWRQGLGKRGRLELGAYYTVWEDVQSDMLEPTGLIETRNAGTAEILGLEGAISVGVGERWTFSAGGTWQDARLVKNATGLALDDSRLPVVPEFTLRASAEHFFDLGALDGSVRLRLRYTGPARLSFDPALDRPMGDYLAAGFELRLNFGRLRAALAVDNLLMEKADQFAFGNPLRAYLQDQYVPLRPLDATVSLGWSL